MLTQELAAIEGLARVDVICLDKTGTLTEGDAGPRRGRAARRPPPAPTTPATSARRRLLAALARADDHPNPSLRAIGAGLRRRPRAGPLTEHGAVLVGPQVERGGLRRPRRLGARRARRPAARQAADASPRVGRRARREPTPTRDGGCCSWRPPRRGLAGDRAARRARARRAGGARRAAAAVGARHHRLLRRAGRDREGHLGRQPRDGGRGGPRLRRRPAPTTRSTPASSRRRPRGPGRDARAPRVFGRVTPQQKRAMVHGAAVPGPRGGHDRRRRERHAGAQGRRHRRGHGRGQRRGPRRWPASCCSTTTSPSFPEVVGRGSAGHRQRRAGGQPVPDQDLLRPAPGPGHRRQRPALPLHPAPLHAAQRAHHRHPRLLPGAGPQRPAGRARLPGPGAALRRALPA